MNLAVDEWIGRRTDGRWTDVFARVDEPTVDEPTVDEPTVDELTLYRKKYIEERSNGLDYCQA
jgi:hypothetical protein